MLAVRRSEDRGRTRLSWLDSHHSFSFGGYLDPDHMGFRALRVLNEDVVAPGAGFGAHPHRDAEILTIVLEGALEHRDSEGSRGVLEPGDVQCMTAGRGIVHSELNASQQSRVHFLQIWFEADRLGREPGYQERHGAFGADSGGAQVLASSKGDSQGLTLHQDAQLRAGRFAAGSSWEPALPPGRHAWLQLIRGRLKLGEHVLRAGDAAAASGETRLPLCFEEDSQVLLIDMA